LEDPKRGRNEEKETKKERGLKKWDGKIACWRNKTPEEEEGSKT